jgi:hypothetical protein
MRRGYQWTIVSIVSWLACGQVIEAGGRFYRQTRSGRVERVA